MGALTRAHLFKDDGTDVLMTNTCVPLPFSRLALALIDSYWIDSIGLSDLEQAIIDKGIASLMESMSESVEECSSSMIGMIVLFPAPGNIPANTLECNGQQFDVNEYPKLYAFLASNTLPNLKNRFALGDGLRNPGVTGGSDSHVLTVSELPAHSHVQEQFSQQPSGVSVGKDVTVYEPVAGATWTNGSNQAHNNMPPYYVGVWAIVAR